MNIPQAIFSYNDQLTFISFILSFEYAKIAALNQLSFIPSFKGHIE